MGIAAGVNCFAQSATPVPATFFEMSALPVTDAPKIPVGGLGHPGFAWETIEQSKGVFDFRTFDNYVATAQQLGLVDSATNTVNMSITLGLTPDWAVANQSSCSTPNAIPQCSAPPDNIQDWKNFLTALIQHYNGKTQPHIRYYELWNEAQNTLYWTGTNAQLVALAAAAYPIIHQDPYSVLLSPSVAGPVGNVAPDSGVTWMTAYLQAGGAQYADGGAFHGYLAQSTADGVPNIIPFPMPEQDSTTGCKAFVNCFGSIVTKATQLRAVFDQNGLAGKPMYDTEGSWGNGNITDLDTQIEWLARWYLLQAGLRSTLNLQLASWFAWGPQETWGNIETSGGQATAAGVAYGQVFTWVTGASIGQPCTGAANGTYTCLLSRPSGYLAQAVWNTTSSISYAPGAGYTQYRDLAGNVTPISAGASVPIGAKPILIEGTAAGTGVLANVSAASYDSSPVAEESIATAFGANLAGSTIAAASYPLPTILGTTQVMVTDSAGVTRPAPLIYVSPLQIDYEVPPQTANGLAAVSVTNNGNAVAAGSMLIAEIAPGLFTANTSGQGVASAQLVTTDAIGAQSIAPIYQCGSAAGSCVSVPIAVNTPGSAVVLELYGTGIRNRNSVTNVKCSIGGTAVPVAFAGPQGQFAGLDQVNVPLPASLAGKGEVDLVLTVDGVAANTVRINLQ